MEESVPREIDVYREMKGEDTDAPLAVASGEKQGRSSVPTSQNQSVTRHLGLHCSYAKVKEGLHYLGPI